MPVCTGHQALNVCAQTAPISSPLEMVVNEVSCQPVPGHPHQGMRLHVALWVEQFDCGIRAPNITVPDLAPLQLLQVVDRENQEEFILQLADS